jgi:selenide,water dikinase
VTDHEPKYGLAAIGLVHPLQIWTKGGARPGDVLLLTKPVGTGVVTTALKHEDASEEDVATAVASMMTLNGPAAEALRRVGSVHACTDITGFGLLGHALEMAEQSGVSLALRAGAMAWLPGAIEYAASGHVPGGTGRNRDHVSGHVRFADSISDAERLLLFDPQTSGGLLAAIDAESRDDACQALTAAGVPCYVIGEAFDRAGPVSELHIL